MATSTGQRVFIWAMALVMLLGTLGSFFVFVLEAGQEPVKTSTQLQQEKEMEEYQKLMEEQARARAASSKPLKGYEATKFDGDSVDKLTVSTLKTGKGEEVKSDATIKANYFGWTSDGKIFDSTNQDGKTESVEFSLDMVVVGWKEGLTGAKVGDVVELTIPSDKAYGAAGSPPLIGPNQPLKFIVEIVDIVKGD